MMKYLSLLLTVLLLVSCNQISSFEGMVSEINQNNVLVDCSGAVNKNEKGGIDALGYSCSVEVTKDTVITDNNDKVITINDLESGQMVKVILAKNKNISKGMKSREVSAEKILILN